jgi:hypothetical protein
LAFDEAAKVMGSPGAIASVVIELLADEEELDPAILLATTVNV